MLKDSGECSKGFREMFEQIPVNVQDDSGECSKRFGEMFKMIPGNVQEDSRKSKFRFILWNLAYFFSNSAIKLRQKKGILCTLLLTIYK